MQKTQCCGFDANIGFYVNIKFQLSPKDFNSSCDNGSLYFARIPFRQLKKNNWMY